MKTGKDITQTGARIALVTGASSGIGAAAAAALAAAGFKVYGTSRRAMNASEGAFVPLVLDVTSDASVTATVAHIVAREGRIDLLVNNAGFGIAPAAAEESTLTQAQAVFDCNFFGAVRMTRAVLPAMRAAGGGRIVNIGSALGFLPMPYMALYSASKHAVRAYSEALDHEVRGSGVRVSVIEPAYIGTAFESNLAEPDAPLEAYRAVREGVVRRMKELLLGAEKPALVADMVVTAASARQPSLHYAPGMAARVRLLRRFAPARVLDAGIRKDLRLPA